MRILTVARCMPDARDLKLGVREAVPHYEPCSRNPGFPQTTVLKENSGGRMDGKEIAEESSRSR
jgi:hypothetical protein